MDSDSSSYSSGSKDRDSGAGISSDLFFSMEAWKGKMEVMSEIFIFKETASTSLPVSHQNVDKVPDEENGTVIYFVKINKERDLCNLKAARPWGKTYTSYTRSRPKEKGPRLLKKYKLLCTRYCISAVQRTDNNRERYPQRCCHGAALRK